MIALYQLFSEVVHMFENDPYLRSLHSKRLARVHAARIHGKIKRIDWETHEQAQNGRPSLFFFLLSHAFAQPAPEYAQPTCPTFNSGDVGFWLSGVCGLILTVQECWLLTSIES